MNREATFSGDTFKQGFGDNGVDLTWVRTVGAQLRQVTA